jgi:hypothetical protein
MNVIDALPLFESKKRTGPSPRWDYARYFGGQSSVVRSRNVSLLLYARAFMWFHKVADFRQAEMHLLYKQNPKKEIRSQHCQIIEILIREGKEIVKRIHASGGLIKPANGFSLQDIQSSIEELQNTHLQWNGSLSKNRKEEILKDIFDAA